MTIVCTRWITSILKPLSVNYKLYLPNSTYIDIVSNLRDALYGNHFKTTANLLRKCLTSTSHKWDCTLSKPENVSLDTPEKLVIYLADLVSLKGDKASLSAIKSYLTETNYDYYKSQCELQHFSAQESWVNGNFVLALDEFSKVLNQNQELKATVILMLKRLIIHSVATQGRARVQNVVHFVEEYTRKSSDYDLMRTLWFALFTSSWYEDHQKSLEILQSSKGLQDIVNLTIPKLSARFLYFHQLEEFYRLMEALLHAEMYESFERMLGYLFDYYYGVGNIKGCNSVVACAKTLDFKLGQERYTKYKLAYKKPLYDTGQVVKGAPKFNYRF